MNYPIISVVMSVYNGNIFIKRSVESILNQTYHDFEFIIIDDGSSDGSGRLLEEYAKLHSSIRLVKHSNIGLTNSLIIGCDLARGKYIARQDVDDYSQPERLQLQYEKLENNDELALIGTWYEVIEDNTETVMHEPFDNDWKIRNSMFFKNPFCHSSVMFRKEAYSEVSGYNKNFRTCQDLDLWFRMAVIGKLGIVEQCLVERTIHKDSISTGSNALNQVRNSFYIRKNYINTIKSQKFIYLYIGVFYHLLITFLPSALSKRLSKLVRYLMLFSQKYLISMKAIIEKSVIH
jgi:glycosyltransferase involved in cell wall biosynthesis